MCSSVFFIYCTFMHIRKKNVLFVFSTHTIVQIFYTYNSLDILHIQQSRYSRNRDPCKMMSLLQSSMGLKIAKASYITAAKSAKLFYLSLLSLFLRVSQCVSQGEQVSSSSYTPRLPLPISLPFPAIQNLKKQCRKILFLFIY